MGALSKLSIIATCAQMSSLRASVCVAHCGVEEFLYVAMLVVVLFEMSMRKNFVALCCFKLLLLDSFSSSFGPICLFPVLQRLLRVLRLLLLKRCVHVGKAAWMPDSCILMQTIDRFSKLVLNFWKIIRQIEVNCLAGM